MIKIQQTDALIVVDVQKDFCSGGALPVEEGHRIVPAINRIFPLFSHVLMTRDWHLQNHCSFADPPQFVDGSWPAHCVQNTPGAQFHGDLQIPVDAVIIDTATDPEQEGYSGFSNPELAAHLRRWGAQRIFVCGLAMDYCVKHTALDGLREGFLVFLVEDACRGIDFPPGLTALAVEEIRQAGGRVCWSGDLH